ncbi:MAG: dihydrofolate reductase [Pseudomonadota bacterium]|nr:dihydrofolate reductase [Pseudomonadota bacterium]
MKLSMIVAMSANNVIGVANQLPWHLPEDLKHFKKHTINKPIIMGRNTFDSIGRALPERDNIVLSRAQQLSHDQIFLANNKSDALRMAEDFAKSRGSEEIMIVGGEQIYRMFFDDVSRIYVTLVDLIIDGDAFFPVIDYKIWTSVDHSKRMTANELEYEFVTLEKLS